MMMKRKACVLVVDDEIEIVRALQRSLTGHGYEVLVAGKGEQALEIIEQSSPDLMLLDLALPGMSGLEVCQQVRKQSDLPIIVISVKNKERDKVLALDLGADDYISKPFGINEVLARIRVALRHAARMMPRTEPTVTIGPLQIDFAQQLVTVNGQEVKLTRTEYDLLKVFVVNRGKIMTQQMLLTQVWGTSQDAKAHYLHVYIGQLRRKIEPDPAHPRFLTTISGVGYRFNDE
jgi:two-component system, OmpR family, KDP operon response regulator KdpE